jgi:predicted ATP-dependent serine protease
MPALVMSRPQEPRAIADFLRSAAIAPSVVVVGGEPGIGKLTLWQTGIDAPDQLVDGGGLR